MISEEVDIEERRLTYILAFTHTTRVGGLK